MSSSDYPNKQLGEGDHDDDQQQYTTNEVDQQEAAELQERYRNHNFGSSTSSSFSRRQVPTVQIDPGCYKYVLIRAQSPSGNEEYFVTSKRGAHYHRNAAEPVLEQLAQAGYSDIDVTGGGRIDFQPSKKKIFIYGFSYGFGLANHAISREVVLEDDRYRDYDVTISNEGY